MPFAHLFHLETQSGVSQLFPDFFNRESGTQGIVKIQLQNGVFINGENIKFSLDQLRLDRCSEFQQKVLQAESAIPMGKVSSYGTISLHLNVPGGARAVGTALATNPFPLVIPCHRKEKASRSIILPGHANLQRGYRLDYLPVQGFQVP